MRWGFDFTKLVYRDFENEQEFNKICKKLSKIDFVRLWTMCDPSSDWGHTIKIVNKIRPFIKNIVIVTKHWHRLTEDQRIQLSWIYINTSISALDTEWQIIHRLNEYETLKNYCYSILRVNTCDFIDNKLRDIQNNLLKNENVIDNILRIPKNHN